MKKILCVMMIAVLILTLTVAVAAADVPTVNVVIPSIGAHTETVADVEAAINEILVPKIGAKMHLTYTDFGTHMQQINMMMTNPDEVDVAYLYGSPRGLVENGQLLDITEYVESDQADEIRAAVGAVYVDAAKLSDGCYYYVPSVCDHAQEFHFMANREIMLEMGYVSAEVEEKIWTMDEIHDLIVKAMELHPDIYGVSGVDVRFSSDELGDTYLIGVLEDYGNAEKVTSITDSQEFIDLAYTMRQWYNEGLIMPDILTSTEGTNMVTSGRSFGILSGGCCPSGVEGDESSRIWLTIGTPWIQAANAERMVYAINGLTRYPDEAFAVLKEMYVNEEIKELLSFGIQGVNYVLDDQGRAAYPEGVDNDTATYNIGFGGLWFVFPNGRCDIVSYTQQTNIWNLYETYDNGARISGVLGCVFESANVLGAYAECGNVYTEYFDAIVCGTVDPDTAIPAFRDALKTAGEDQVIAEKQRQLDAFRSSR